MDNKTVEDDDLELIFMYRKVRVGITKPYFQSGSYAPKGLVRSLGIIDEDGIWAYYIDHDPSVELEKVVQIAKDAVDLQFSAASRAESRLYYNWVSLTDSSRDKNALEQVRRLAQTAQMALEDAQHYVGSINDPVILKQALALINKE